MNILFAEDDPSIRDIISIFLKGTHHRFVFAFDGEDALKKLKGPEQFDLIFLDQSMPMKNGIEVAQEFRKWEVENGKAKTTIWAMTAFQDESTISLLEKAGCDDVIIKPVSKKVLVEILSSFETKAA